MANFSSTLFTLNNCCNFVTIFQKFFAFQDSLTIFDLEISLLSLKMISGCLNFAKLPELGSDKLSCLAEGVSESSFHGLRYRHVLRLVGGGMANSSSRKLRREANDFQLLPMENYGRGGSPILGGKGRGNEGRVLFPTPSKQCGRFLRTKHQHRVVMEEKNVLPRPPRGNG